ncbi:hypothetical protein SADUNF_Sadunf01G0125300 [Salix dunnii]|uniref:MSP domain-containing protein n=1 Tax=Salix dunnii TaxID=1413687 RepID=A0A835NB76_9ROSI|nr:hypothetical protein SADUNF_Sadunf01G0125300 [Salix dunnii]
MSTGELLGIEPLELKFPFELKKQISCSLQLSNKTDNYVAFKVKTTNPKKYCVRPNAGIVLPRSTCDVIVTMQAQKEAPIDMQCKDKFLLQSVIANDGVTAKDINAEMFSKEAGHIVEECKLRVLYASPPRPPSPVLEGSEEGSPPRGSVSDNGNVNGTDFSTGTRAFVEHLEPQDKPSEVKLSCICLPDHVYMLCWIVFLAGALILKLTDEKNNAIQQNNKLRQELDQLKHMLCIWILGWDMFGTPETPRQQKSLWCIIYVRHLCWLAWHIFGVSHEEDVSNYTRAISFPFFLFLASQRMMMKGKETNEQVMVDFLSFWNLHNCSDQVICLHCLTAMRCDLCFY